MLASAEFTVEALAQACGGRLLRPQVVAASKIRGVASLHEATADCITWVTEAKHAKYLATTAAGAVLGTEALLAGHERGIVVTDPESAIATVLDLFFQPAEPPPPGVHPYAVVAPSAQIADGVRIGPFAVVHPGVRIAAGTIIHEGVSLGRGVQVGADCTLYDRCILYDRTVVGDRVILHSGVVLGADGFGYLFRDNAHRKLAHIGKVVIEDDVEIGPNSVVDRGKTGPTRIGRGTKIDALVMIGHNVRIGPLCVLAGQSGLSGSVQLGKGVAVAGQAGFVNGITVGDGVRVAAQAGVFSNVEPGLTILGTPAQDNRKEMQSVVRVRKLQKLYDEVAELRRRIQELETAANHRTDG